MSDSEGRSLTILAPTFAPAGQQPALSDFPGEDERARVMASFGCDALQDDPELQAIARFAARLCEAPIALVSMVERDRQCFLGRVGIDLLAHGIIPRDARGDVLADALAELRKPRAHVAQVTGSWLAARSRAPAGAEPQRGPR